MEINAALTPAPATESRGGSVVLFFPISFLVFFSFPCCLLGEVWAWQYVTEKPVRHWRAQRITGILVDLKQNKKEERDKKRAGEEWPSGQCKIDCEGWVDGVWMWFSACFYFRFFPFCLPSLCFLLSYLVCALMLLKYCSLVSVLSILKVYVYPVLRLLCLLFLYCSDVKIRWRRDVSVACVKMPVFFFVFFFHFLFSFPSVYLLFYSVWILDQSARSCRLTIEHDAMRCRHARGSARAKMRGRETREMRK